MKNNSGRIPLVIDTFNAYINNTEAYLRLTAAPPAGVTSAPAAADISMAAVPLLPNWQRLGMLDTEMASWTNFKNQWNLLYAKYSDKEESRTIAIKTKLRGVQKSFRAFAQPLLNMMSGIRTATADDAAVLNFVLVRKNPTHPTTSLTEVVVPFLTNLGGSQIKVKCRGPEDTKHYSKPKGATGVEMFYVFGETPPKDRSECKVSFYSSKSIWKMSFDPGMETRNLYAYFRWVVATDPSRNGPWSGQYNITIL